MWKTVYMFTVKSALCGHCVHVWVYLISIFSVLFFIYECMEPWAKGGYMSSWDQLLQAGMFLFCFIVPVSSSILYRWHIAEKRDLWKRCVNSWGWFAAEVSELWRESGWVWLKTWLVFSSVCSSAVKSWGVGLLKSSLMRTCEAYNSP